MLNGSGQEVLSPPKVAVTECPCGAFTILFTTKVGIGQAQVKRLLGTPATVSCAVPEVIPVTPTVTEVDDQFRTFTEPPLMYAGPTVVPNPVPNKVTFDAPFMLTLEILGLTIVKLILAWVFATVVTVTADAVQGAGTVKEMEVGVQFVTVAENPANCTVPV